MFLEEKVQDVAAVAHQLLHALDGVFIACPAVEFAVFPTGGQRVAGNAEDAFFQFEKLVFELDFAHRTIVGFLFLCFHGGKGSARICQNMAAG